jgi:hypothetical protein
MHEVRRDESRRYEMKFIVHYPLSIVHCPLSIVHSPPSFLPKNKSYSTSCHQAPRPFQ